MGRSVESMEGQGNIGELARRLKLDMPSLSDLTRESLEEIAKAVIYQRLVRDLDFEVAVAGIDCAEETALFLENAGKSGSKATHKTYTHELEKLRRYCEQIRTQLIEFTPQHTDNYIMYLVNMGYSPASIALSVSAASSLCNFIERRHSDGVTVRFRNPFKGSRIKPKVKAARPLLIPAEEEVQYLLKKLPPEQAAMVALMSGLGLRSGALGTLVIEGNEFSCVTKGKAMTGTIPDALLVFLKRRVRRKKPFSGARFPALKRALDSNMERLFKEGGLKARYSCHCFRHYFAIREYGKDKDIWRVSRLLNHASLASTEKYLKGLGGLE